MTEINVAQLTASVIVAVTPWSVVGIAFLVARRHARAAAIMLERPAVLRVLDGLTIAALMASGAAALTLPPRWLLAVYAAVFIVLAVAGLRSLAAIEDGSRPACEVESAVRVADLRPRRLSHHVPTTWRVTLFALEGAGLALIAWRLLTPSADRRLLVPLAFALAAPVFSWLYEVWMRELASGGHAEPADRNGQGPHRYIRQIFAAEAILVMSSLSVAHGLLDLDWDRHGAWGAALGFVGAGVAIAGCALAISSELISRRYRSV